MFRQYFKQSWLFVLVLIILCTAGTALGSPTVELPERADVALGETGVSFGYADTFGHTGEPYPVDAEHLYGPNGLVVDKDDELHVVEQAFGQRAVEYGYDPYVGFFTKLIIGHPGVPGYEEDYLNNPADVAVTTTDHTWVVMDSAVKEFDETGKLVNQIPDEVPPLPGSDTTHFDDPRGLAFDYLDRLYVADTHNHRVQVYNTKGGLAYYETITGTVGMGDPFSYPVQLSFVGQLPLFLVTDSGNHRLQSCRYVDPGWICETYLGVKGVPGSDLAHLDTPTGITTDQDFAYIVDAGNRRVLKCVANTVPATGCSVFVGTGGPGGADLFDKPADVAVDSAGYVFVSDLAKHHILIFDSDGNVDGVIGTTLEPYATAGTYFYQPAGTVVDAAGSLYVLEDGGRRLSKVTAGGSIAWDYGYAGRYGSAADYLGTAQGGPEGKPAVDANGLIYLPDSPRHRVVVLNANGTYLAQLGVMDTPGTDNAHFDYPAGVAISPLNGDVFVLDRGNRRIQVFTKDRAYKGTLSTASLCGTDLTNCQPWDVAVDKSGYIFVADAGNMRVQKCTSLTSCAKFAGTTGETGTDFNHLSPVGVAVDAKGRLYVADGGEHQRVQVYNASGAYLTTVGGGDNSIHSGFNGLVGVAVGANGMLYATDQDNFRVQKFSPGYNGWKQANINGFGNPAQNVISTLEAFGSYLYAGTWSAPSQVWRTSDGTNWSQVTPAWTAVALGGGAVFDGELYLGVYAMPAGVPTGQVWRTGGLGWEAAVPDGFGDPTVVWINDLEVFKDQIYAVTENSDKNMQVWRYPKSAEEDIWERVGVGVLDAVDIRSQKVFFVYNNQLYLGRSNAGKAEIWSSPDGAAWSLLEVAGLGIANSDVSAFAEFAGKLFVGFRNEIQGGEVWVSEDGLTFSQVFGGGLGDVDNIRPYSLQDYNNALYLSFSNEKQGAEVWKTTNGVTWDKIMSHGWGDWNNTYASYFDKSSTVFRNTLYFATINNANGGEVWKMLHLINLPLVVR